MMNESSLAFSAGVVGALANGLALWLFGVSRLNRMLGVDIAPALSAQWLYPRLVWGGLWGLLFATPLLEGQGLTRGLWLSLAPSLAQLLYFFPYHARKGFFGMQLGRLTPAIALIVNAIWGWVAAFWLRAAGGAL
jgi:hypothetical protein